MRRHQVNRRNFLAGSAGGFFALAMRNQLARAFAGKPQGKAKRCVVLWMNGGPSQFETFDPKPGTATGGEIGTIQTRASGLTISETLPQISKQMDQLSVLRCLTSPEGEHIRAQYFLHTGYPFIPDFPRPAMGAIVSHETPKTAFPRYITIGSQGYGPAYMGHQHAPFSIEDPQEALELLRNIRRKKGRIGLLKNLGGDFDRRHKTAIADRRRAMISSIDTLVTTPFVDTLDLKRESAQVRSRYGDHPVGRACLLARRLLEFGVNFVEVQQDGWDTHSNNFAQTRKLCQAIDQPWSALMEDLKSSGMLDDTIVIWMGDFGRTPRINANRGRDHFPLVTPVVIGGGPIAGGQIVGKTNKAGTQIEGTSYKAADLFATIFTSLGLDPSHEFQTSFGSPAAATDGGSAIKELL